MEILQEGVIRTNQFPELEPKAEEIKVALAEYFERKIKELAIA